MVKFWPTKSGQFLSHSKGLDLSQTSFFKQFKIGDQLIIFVNDDGSLTLKQSKPKEEKQNDY